MSAPVTEDQTGTVVYRRLLKYSLGYWQYLLVAVVALVISAATEPLFARILQPLLDGAFLERDPDIIKWAPVAIILIFIIRGVSSFAATYLMQYVGRTVIKRIRGDIFEHMLNLPVRYYDQASSGELLSRITFNTEQVAGAAVDSLTILIRDTATIIGLLALMFYYSWELTLAFLVIGPFVTLLIAFVTKRFRQISHRIQRSMGEVTHVAEEMIEGQRVVKIFGGQEYEKAHFEEANDRNRYLQMKMTVTHAASVPIVQLLVAGALSAIIYIATSGDNIEQITPGVFASFMTAMLMLMAPIKRLTQVNALVQRGIAAGENIFGLLDTPTERDEGTLTLERARGKVEYRDVRFSYSPDKGEVLKGISFTINPGETVALVGRSGSGKTTVANLLPRFYDIGDGQILLDGEPIERYRLVELRNQIAYVGQGVTLFNDSIGRNIAYGRLGDTPQEQILKAAEAAHALEFIHKLPDGLDTLVGENGVLLSGGQRQRLAIARALLKDAPILILDEATSALDTESERHIQAAIEELVKNRTTLVIAHRLSTIEKADRILVMQDGEIVESGNHQELLALNGQYANLHRMQFHESD